MKIARIVITFVICMALSLSFSTLLYASDILRGSAASSHMPCDRYLPA